MPEPEQPPHPRHHHALEERIKEMEQAMAVHKEAKERAAVVDPMDPTSHFTGLSGVYKYLGSLGVIGTLSLLLIWVVMIEIPGARQKFVDVLLQIEADHRVELVREHQDCRGDAQLWRNHANAIAGDVARQMDRLNARVEAQNKQAMANHVDTIWLLQLYAPKQKVSKDIKPIGFIGPPTLEEDVLARIRERIELLPTPDEAERPAVPNE